MKKINFVNNDAPYLSAENFNQMQDNIEEAINGYVLYDNANGSKANITLSETSANFKYLEIFYYADSNYNNVKVYLPNNKQTILKAGTQNNSNRWDKWQLISINNNTITRQDCYVLKSGNNSANIYEVDNSLYIIRVVGYK